MRFLAQDIPFPRFSFQFQTCPCMPSCSPDQTRLWTCVYIYIKVPPGLSASLLLVCAPASVARETTHLRGESVIFLVTRNPLSHTRTLPLSFPPSPVAVHARRERSATWKCLSLWVDRLSYKILIVTRSGARFARLLLSLFCEWEKRKWCLYICCFWEQRSERTDRLDILLCMRILTPQGQKF